MKDSKVRRLIRGDLIIIRKYEDQGGYVCSHTDNIVNWRIGVVLGRYNDGVLLRWKTPRTESKYEYEYNYGNYKFWSSVEKITEDEALIEEL